MNARLAPILGKPHWQPTSRQMKVFGKRVRGVGKGCLTHLSINTRLSYYPMFGKLITMGINV